MKLLLSYLFVLVSSIACSAQQISGDYTVYKITKTEDGDYILFIKNDVETGLVVMDNDSLVVDKNYKNISEGKKYFFLLEKDEKKFNGEQPSGYMIILNSGQTQKIWDVKKDGEMPSIYTAKNVKGLFIDEYMKY
jgi:hypothetical protein